MPGPSGISAAALSDRLGKPGQKEGEVLSKLFPSSSKKRKTSCRPFDPTAECCVSAQQKRKKAATTGGRPTNVKVVVMPKFLPVIPRGARRTKLFSEGRVKSVQFKRSMDYTEVKSVVSRAFTNIPLASWKYLECSRDNRVQFAASQQLNG